MINPVKISAYTVSTALGAGVLKNQNALRSSRSGLKKNTNTGSDFNLHTEPLLDTYIGEVDGVDDVVLPETLSDFDCRNNRLAELALQQDDFLQKVNELKQRYDPKRIGLFIGTSTSGIQQTEMAYAARDEKLSQLPDWFHYKTTHDVYSPVAYLSRRLGVFGPSQIISTACSSSARVFAAAARHIAAGFCDAAIVGGVDSLCQMTLYGFNALQLVSGQPCRPADAKRDGINIGEAAGFVILETESAYGDISLLAYGESSDAWHMSSPHPQGAGAVIAMQKALKAADLQVADIDYINLHGTATPANDISEDKAMMSVYSGINPCSSTKGFTGHTLGAAGIVAAAFSCIAIEQNFLPSSLNTQTVDSEIKSNIVLDKASTESTPNSTAAASSIDVVMSNAFGFGGSNASLIIGRRK